MEGMRLIERVCIVGGGLAGLSAAYDLGRHGHTVLVIESSNTLGGLASSLSIGDKPVERFYHFICRADADLLNLLVELRLEDRLHWEPTKTKFYYDGNLYGFGSPIDLLRFSPVPFLQRIRFGLNIVHSRYRKAWRRLDKIAARTWLIKRIGQQAYDVIWDPLLRVKFGDVHDQISAAWIWHRINRVATSRRRIWESEYLGYLEYGSETIIGELAARLRQMPNVEIRTGTNVQRVYTNNHQVIGVQVEDSSEIIPCSDVISTVALPVVMKLVPDLDPAYQERLAQVEYLGVVCGLLKLRYPITDSFWVNINDPRIPFNGFIEYTNLNRELGANLDGSAIVYVPYYLPTTDERFHFSDEELLEEFIDGLSYVNPNFDRSWIEEYHVSRAAYAQAICPTGFSDIMPDHQTPTRGLYITDSTQFYPEDRTISAAIRLGRNVARMIMESPVNDA